MATFTDSFNGASPDLTWASSRNETSTSPGTLPTTNGDGTGSLGGPTWQYARADHATGSADMYAEMLVTTANGSGGPNRRIALMLRAGTGTTGSSSALTLLVVVLSLTDSEVSFLQFEGNYTPISGEAIPGPLPGGDQAVTIPSTPFLFRVEAQGNALRAYFDGVLVASSTTVGTGPTGTRGGIGANGAPATHVRFDSFRTGALADLPPAAPVVDAGADATLTLGATFTRTATETGSPTSRAWSIVSGPAGQGSTLATTAALSWTPTVAGTYVLRYSATNAQGTGNDDVTVTVTTPPDEDARRNEQPNPSAANNITGWSSNGSIERVTGLAAPWPRPTAGRVTFSDGPWTEFVGAPRVAAQAGQTWSAVATVMANRATQVQVGIVAWGPTGYLGAIGNTFVDVAANTPTTVNMSGTLDATEVATVTELAVSLDGPQAQAGDMLTMGAVRLEQVDDPALVYRDGDSPGWVWDGVAGASTSRVAPGPQLVDTYTVELANIGAMTTAAFTPRENEVLVVKASSGHSDVALSVPTGGGLTYTERAFRRDASYAPVVLSVATVGPNPGPMAVTVTATGGTSGQVRGSTLVVERWAYATDGGAAALVMESGNPTAPAVNLTATEPAAVFTWLSSDWQAVTGAAVLRGAGVQTHARRTPSVINVWTGYSPALDVGTPTALGLSAPTGQKWAFAALQLTPGPAPIESTGPDTAAERYGWGTPLDSSDEFDVIGAPDPARWGVYDGPGHNDGDGPNGTRDPDQVQVIAGTAQGDPASFLRIAGNATGDTGGLAHMTDLRYGRWEMRARWGAVTPGGPGESYHAVLIIWPADYLEKPDWPQYGEYDFVEIEDVEQNYLAAYLHYPHPPGDVEQEYVTANPRTFDFTDFHNYAFEWVEGALRCYVDGDEWAGPPDLDGSQLSSSGDRLDGMPAGHLAIQLDNFTGEAGLQPAYLDVEWMRVYTADGSTQIGSGDGATGTALDQAGTGGKTTTGDGGALVDLAAHSTGSPVRHGGGDTPLEVAATATAGTTTRTGAGTAGLALDTVGDGARLITGTGMASAALATAGDGVREGEGTGTTGALLATAGDGTPGPRTGAGSSTTALGAVGDGTGDRASTGTAGVELGAAGSGRPVTSTGGLVEAALAADGSGHGVRDTAGATGAVLATAGAAGTVVRSGRGVAAGLTLDSAGDGRAIRARGHANLTLAAGGAGWPTRTTTGTTGVGLAQAGTAGLVERHGDGATGAALDQAAHGLAHRDGTGPAGTVLGAAGTGAAGPRTGAGSTGLVLDEPGTGTGVRASTGTAGHVLDGHGDGTGERASTGAAELVLDGHGDGDGARASTGATGAVFSAAGSAERRVRGRGDATATLAATGDGHGRTTHGAGGTTLPVSASGTGTRHTAGAGAVAPVLLGEVGENRTRRGHGHAGEVVLGQHAAGWRNATGRGAVGVVLAEYSTGTRATTGAGAAETVLDRDPAGDKTATGDGTVGTVVLGQRPDGVRVAVGRGRAGLTLDEGAAAGVTLRPGRGTSTAAFTAAGTGTPGPRHGTGRARLGLVASGSALRRTRGRGEVGVLLLSARPRRIVPGRTSRAWHGSNAGTRASHGPRQEANSAR